jgi:large subunit ribosomal protein L25
MPKLKATTRVAGKKTAELRAEGSIPAVFYGAKEAATSVIINVRDFRKVWKEIGETGTVELETPNGVHDAMIYDVQVDPVKSEPIHVDFYIIEKGQKVEVEVPLEFEGNSLAIKNGGILVKVLHTVEVEGEPKNIPHVIKVSIDSLVDGDSQIFVKDIKLPAGITLITDEEEVVASIAEAEEEVEAAPTAIDMAAIEVEKKGKKEEEEAAAE